MDTVADRIAARVRRWYENNRETWWDRLGVDQEERRTAADEFILKMVEEVRLATLAEVPPPVAPAPEPQPPTGRLHRKRLGKL